MTSTTETRTTAQAMKAEADRRTAEGYDVTAQWHEELGDWYLVYRRSDRMPVEVIYQIHGRALAERIDTDDPTVNPYTYVDHLLDKTVDGRCLH